MAPKSKSLTRAHRRLAFKHAKEHTLNLLKEMFEELLHDEHHSVILSSDGVDCHDEVLWHLERFRRHLRRKVTSTAFNRVDNTRILWAKARSR